MENEINYKINKDIGIEIPKGVKLMTFQNCFTFLRKSLHIKYIRKSHIDNILKKCKGKFYKAIYNCLQQCVKIKIKKLPQAFITNISIDYNKQFLEFTINNLYDYFNLMPFPMEIFLNNNYCIKGKESYFKYILLSRIDYLYSIYIQSNRYKKEIKLLKKKEGIKMAFLYQFVSENFLSYYYYSKPHIKKQKNIETNNNNSENISFINNNILENNNNNNENENINMNINITKDNQPKQNKLFFRTEKYL